MIIAELNKLIPKRCNDNVSWEVFDERFYMIDIISAEICHHAFWSLFGTYKIENIAKRYNIQMKDKCFLMA